MLLPGHVCTITGSKPFEFIADELGITGVISGSNLEDVVQSIETLIKSIHKPSIHIQYKRAVTIDGNGVAQKVIQKVFEPCDVSWRGFDLVKDSGLAIKQEWSFFDALKRWGIEIKCKQNEEILENICCCGDIMQGLFTPIECPLFKISCKPESPKGPCMVFLPKGPVPSTINTEGKTMSVVQIAHGGGGKLTEDLIKEVFVKTFDNEIINGMEDSAVINLESVNLAFTTDSYTVKPLFFPGGDIGKLAVYGTVNDLLMRGARPLFLSASFIIEEGFEIEGLKAVATSMAGACQEARVSIVTGDTKVVAKGEADQLFINTSGVGLVPPGVDVSIKKARPGDSIIISGTIGDHGMAILSSRENFTFDPPVESDCAPLKEMANTILEYRDFIRVIEIQLVVELLRYSTIYLKPVG